MLLSLAAALGAPVLRRIAQARSTYSAPATASVLDLTCSVLPDSGEDAAVQPAPRRPVITDECDRVLFQFVEPTRRHSLSIDASAERFVSWMYEEGFDGWCPTDWIEEFYAWHCDVTGQEPHGVKGLLTVLPQVAGVLRERRRLLGPDHAFLRRRLGVERSRLYYFPTADEQADVMCSAPRGRLRARARPVGRHVGQAQASLFDRLEAAA